MKPIPFNPAASHVPALKTVTASDDLSRVIALPRRAPLDLTRGDAAHLVRKWTAKLGRKRASPCECRALGWPCITELRPAQAWALEEASEVGGILGPIGVGHGKTGLDLLIPLVVPGCRLAVLLVPPELRGQIVTAYKLWSEHFSLPSIRVGSTFGKIQPGKPSIHVIAYSELQRAESTQLLEAMKPDVIIADEGHKLRNKDTARTGRFLRYLAQNPQTRLFTWSGTLLGKSLDDVAHLAAFALKEGSPLPLDPGVVDEWAAAVDPSDDPAPLGPLRRLLGSHGSIESAMHARIIETPGVVSTKEGAIESSILIDERPVKSIPLSVREALANLRKTWTRLDGEELVDAMEVARVAREIAAGFYYRWIFPKGEPPELIDRWFAARKAWHKELREKLKVRAPHLDSPLLLARAAARYHLGEKTDLPVWASKTYLDWFEIRDQVYHESEAVWIDDYLARDAAAWATEHRGVVWYQHAAFGRKVGDLAQIAVHGGGPGAEARILAERGDRSIAASIKSHGTGRDGLQRYYAEQLVANPPSSGADWEQLLGRLHRVGQQSDEVTTWVYRHTEEYADAIDSAVRQSRWVQSISGSLQKLVNATCAFALTRV